MKIATHICNHLAQLISRLKGTSIVGPLSIKQASSRLSTSLPVSYLLAATAILLLSQIAFVTINHPLDAYTDTIWQAKLTIPRVTQWALTKFILIQTAVHIAFTLVIWQAGRWLGAVFSLDGHRTARLTFILWSLSVIYLFLLNQLYYPASQFAALTRVLIPTAWLGPLVILMGIPLYLSLLVAYIAMTVHCFHRLKVKWQGKITASQIAILIPLLIGLSVLFLFDRQNLVEATTEPNVIIIGMDSLRPDHLKPFGSKKDFLPFTNHWLTKASLLEESYTPLARTFPAWVAILTGEYPLANGARFNLIHPNHIKLSQSLETTLKHIGYSTWFATDENRFSNIDNHFGFDRIIGPPMGADEALIGTFNDFPLSNLITGTQLGSLLFPHNVANRASFITYQPTALIKKLAASLPSQSQHPAFISIHLCLGHWPYVWSQHQHTPKSTAEAQQRYEEALTAMDHQFKQIITLLKKKKLLDHAILVLLSDHGEALEWPHDSWIAGKGTEYGPALAVGHGTNVLSPAQYRNLLAFKIYNQDSHDQPLKTGMIKGRASLVDIAPTVFELLHQPFPSNHGSGRSLAQALHRGTLEDSFHRPLFIETGFITEAIKSTHPNMPSVVSEALAYYQLDPKNGHVILKEERLPLILSTKQRAMIKDHWLLASFPGIHKQYYLVDLSSGKWTDHLNSTMAKEAHIKELIADLHSFYDGRQIQQDKHTIDEKKH